MERRREEKVQHETERRGRRERKKAGTGRHVPNNICEGGRTRRGSRACVRAKAFQTTSVMRATSVMRGREEERKRRSSTESVARRFLVRLHVVDTGRSLIHVWWPRKHRPIVTSAFILFTPLLIWEGGG